jgi:hypothetical protein
MKQEGTRKKGSFENFILKLKIRLSNWLVKVRLISTSVHSVMELVL